MNPVIAALIAGAVCLVLGVGVGMILRKMLAESTLHPSIPASVSFLRRMNSAPALRYILPLQMNRMRCMVGEMVFGTNN